MKPIVEQQSPHAATELVACEIFRGRDFGCVWHQHPEVEITLVKRGGTQRRVGDTLSPLRPGDLVMLGSGLPHDYRNDPLPGRKPRPVAAVVVQFLPNFLGDGWLDKPALAKISRLFQRARSGLEITGRTREQAARRLQRLAKATGLRRLVHLLELLEELAHSTELREIASPGLQEAGAGRDRMGPVCEYIERHLAEPLYLPDLARRTGLSESAFSRLFMKCTSRTLPQYVNELRIARACRLLAETDQTVNEIAAGCGYSSLANFQRQFQKVQHRPPLAYRGIVRRTR